MIIVMGEARLAPGEFDRLRETLLAQVAATRGESGCEHYSFAQDITDPDTLRISERWTDEAAIEAHFASPHMALFNAELATAKIESLSVDAYHGVFMRALMGD